ncbi:hypothetical protein PAHAL_5G402200 [Panicum hallii]|jgi:hypothetical protein|uniref:Uncharacterized protein n=1 Tax=Panicum hallii TaxID=206008 RepID=A0A2S3HWM0_9POAL|nr:hypothetical protein PAHAL_5G402200 [Panicum hallii]
MVRSLHVFRPRHARGEAEQQRNSPARVVREALGKALVDYYPFAGRFVDGAGGPASARVECTGEGAWFVEASAACGLEDVACLNHHPLAIPAEDLLPDVESGVQPLDIPLMMQVTEFTCGGFVVGLSSSHALTDGLGAGQFINAVGDYARGLPKPRVSPTWARDLVPNLPKLHLAPPPESRPANVPVPVPHRGPEHRQRQHGQVPVPRGDGAALLTRSLRLPDPLERVTLCFFADARRHVPKDGAGAPGFYGNCFYPVTLAAEAGAVARADVAGVEGMVRGAKARLAAEFARWAAGELLGEEEPYALWLRREPLFVSDWRRLGFLEADYGWGAPSHVAPLATLWFMPVALIVTPPAPRTGVRVTTRCVEEEHMPAFREEMTAFEE